MKGNPFLRCLSLAVALAAGAGLWAGEPGPVEEPPEMDENVGILEHERTPLPDSHAPPIRFKKLFTLEGIKGRGLEYLAFSPEGRMLAAARAYGYENPDVVLWDLQKRKLVHVLLHADECKQVTTMAFVPPGDRLVTACHELNKVFLWDVRSGKLLRTLEPEGHPRYGVTGLAAFPDGKRVLCCAFTGLIVWDLETNAHKALPMDEHVPLRPDMPVHPRHCYKVAFTADGSRFASTVQDVFFLPRILLWDAKTCRVTGVIPMWRVGPLFLACAPDGSSLATDCYTPGGPGPTLTVWDVATGKLVYRFERPGRIGGIAVSPDNKLLALSGSGSNIEIHAIEYAQPSQGSRKAPPGPKP